MYQFPYADILADDMAEARRNERAAFDRVIDMLEIAEKRGAGTREEIEALFYLRKFWMILMDDLVHPGNGLPDDLRAGLISIGLWVLKEVEAVRNQAQSSLAELIDINRTVRDGLR